MTQQITTSERRSDQDVLIAGLRLSAYWRMARWPVDGIALVEAVLLITGQPWPYLWAVNLLLFAALTYWLHARHALSFGSATTMGIIAGLSLGFVVALFRLIFERKAYLLFNLITEPLVTAAGGFLLSSLVFSILHRSPESSGKQRGGSAAANRKEVSPNAGKSDET